MAAQRGQHVRKIGLLRCLEQGALSYGALVWAAAGTNPGLSPEMICDHTRRLSRYREADLVDVHFAHPFDFAYYKRTFLNDTNTPRCRALREPRVRLHLLGARDLFFAELDGGRRGEAELF